MIDHVAPPRPPVAARTMLERPRLVAELRRRWSRRVVSVVAGAGFGKSTLLAQALEDNRLDPAGIDAWVTCTRESAAASVLARSLAGVVGAVLADLTAPEALAEAVGDGMAGHAPVPVCIVIDDVHELPAGSGGAELLTALVDRLPSNGRLLLASRLPPPVPLARLVAQGAAVCLDEDDLAFTAEELDAFARLRGVDGERLAGAGNWPAIVELRASAARPVVGEFLWEEVLAAMAPERRRVLGALAALDGADAAELSAAMGRPADPVAAVADLPMATVSAEGRVQLHALWHEPLAGELTDDERRALRRGAADRALADGDGPSAFRRFVDADAWPEALAIVRDVCTVLFPPLDVDVMESWLADLEASVPDAPEVGLLRGVVRLARQDDPSTVSPMFEQAQAAFAAAGDASGELAAIVQRFGLGFITRDNETQVSAILQGLELAERGHEAALPLAALARCGVAVVAHDYEGAIRELDSVDPAVLDPAWRALRAWMHGEQLLSLGRPDEALLRFAVAASRPGDPIAGRLDDGRIQATLMAGRVEEALALAQQVIDRASAGGGTLHQGFGALVARMEAQVGLVEEGAADLAAAYAQGEPTERVTHARLRLASAMVAIGRADEDGARDALAAPEGEDPEVLRRAVALPYVLDPSTRPFWDSHDMGPALARARSLARALVALRERGDLAPMRALPALEAGSMRAALPLPWAAELAVGAEAAGHPDGRLLAIALGPRARPWIERIRATEGTVLAAAAKRLLAAIPVVPDQVTDVRFLGPAELHHGEWIERGPEWRRSRVRELLAYLVTHPTATRESVGEALWPDRSAQAVANNLRVNLTHLLRALQPGREPHAASYFLEPRDPVLALRGRDRLRVDVWDFEARVTEARRADEAGTPTQARSAYLDAVACWRGRFLADIAPAWADGEADRLQSTYVAAAVRAGELCLAAGDASTADGLARRALDTDPWSEAAYRVLMAGHLARGDVTAAREAGERCRAMLAELGVSPAPETVMIERRLTVSEGLSGSR